jgi:hypothetical protein
VTQEKHMQLKTKRGGKQMTGWPDRRFG